MISKSIIGLALALTCAYAGAQYLNSQSKTFVLDMHYEQIGPAKRICGGWKTLIVHQSATGSISVPGWVTLEEDLPAGHVRLRLLKSGRTMGLSGQIAGNSMWGTYTDSNGCTGYFSTEFQKP